MQCLVVGAELRAAAGQRGRGLDKVIAPAEQRLHLRDEHGAVERLRDEIVRAHVHRRHNVEVVRRRGEEHDRHVGNFPQLRTPVIAALERQHQIEQHELWIKCAEFSGHVAEILHGPHGKAPVSELRTQRLGDPAVVLHQKYPVHRFPSCDQISARTSRSERPVSRAMRARSSNSAFSRFTPKPSADFTRTGPCAVSTVRAVRVSV